MSVEDRMAPVVAGTVERTVPALSRAASSARGGCSVGLFGVVAGSWQEQS